MKIIKIVLGVFAALWALAMVPKLILGFSHAQGEFAFSRNMGSLVGILLITALSIALFKSAFRE
jgi:hypothetical protein